MARFYPQRDYIAMRAELRANELGGKPLPRSTPQDKRKAAARREIENRRIEKEARA
ncbi:hypothetical protein [Pseudogulbenkiania ferrooxidans]|uniref:Uncharacterized protein n=1 Tax=Pseudogulbenkiania ferrooxidans 2002 TaxID=279714 RepID=B9YYS1_9NEIS|nr:hypothetical protein [Pseudogulbenkiania ferrooxidans]EEG10274.1 hypothetical protein FuraDRAFT_0256 [Pseudogulbenkiania ferrooxidans 2002]